MEPTQIKITGGEVRVLCGHEPGGDNETIIRIKGGFIHFTSGTISLEKKLACMLLVKDDQGPTPSSSC